MTFLMIRKVIRSTPWFIPLCSLIDSSQRWVLSLSSIRHTPGKCPYRAITNGFKNKSYQEPPNYSTHLRLFPLITYTQKYKWIYNYVQLIFKILNRYGLSLLTNENSVINIYLLLVRHHLFIFESHHILYLWKSCKKISTRIRSLYIYICMYIYELLTAS